MKKIGLLVGSEWAFPPAFLEEVNRRDIGVEAEYVRLGGIRMDEPCAYAVLIDRISHEVPFYRPYLKNAVLQGTYVINNPFWWSADDKFFESCLATKLGVAVPRTVMLPMKSYGEGVSGESLRNLDYPLDWRGIVDYVGVPAVLKDTRGQDWKHVYKVNNIDELIHVYDQTGQLCMILQEYIAWEKYVRCMCVGPDAVLPMRYDPERQEYTVDSDYLPAELRTRIVRDAQTLNSVLGYDVNSIEFAIRDGVPYVIDFMNPAPALDINRMTPEYFRWAVVAMADHAIELAFQPRSQQETPIWPQFLGRPLPAS